MSCTYADGLSEYENKGVLGLPEVFDSEEDVDRKCKELVDLLKSAKHVVVHTGAGISTAAGIPDFRGPNGVWTLQKKGERPTISVSFDEAQPTMTHLALKALLDNGYVHYLVSQNIDGLHLKSGVSRSKLAELHGNMFVEECNKCHRQFVRTSAAETVGQKPCGGRCRAGPSERSCRGGLLLDNVLDWEANLPERDLDMALMHSTLADLNITLGTTLQIIPSGNLPLKNKKYGGKLVICNLQPTKHDKKADLLISTYVDVVLSKVCKSLGIEIPDYDRDEDPTKNQTACIEWTLHAQLVKDMDKRYNATIKEHNLQRKLGKCKTLPQKEDIKKSKKFKKEED